MRPRRFILPQAGTGGYGIRPYVFCGGQSPPAQRAVPRAEFSPFVENETRRGAFYMRPRRFALPQALAKEVTENERVRQQHQSALTR